MKGNDITIKYGIIMFLGFLGFFIIMKILSLNSNFNLRILNGLVHLPIVYFAIREYKTRADPGEFTYSSGILIGIQASFVGVLSFALFQFFFLNVDGALMNYIQENAPLGAGQFLNPFSASLYLFMEGMVAGMFASYLGMRIVDMQTANT